MSQVRSKGMYFLLSFYFYVEDYKKALIAAPQELDQDVRRQ